MKTLLNNTARFLMIAACASLGFTSSAFAGSGQPVHIDKVADFTYVVKVSNPSQKVGKVQLVRVQDGALLYQGTSSKASFGRKINVGRLADGQYAFVVEVGNETHRYTLDVQTSRTSSLNGDTMASR